jgi:hypothetical protein
MSLEQESEFQKRKLSVIGGFAKLAIEMREMFGNVASIPIPIGVEEFACYVVGLPYSKVEILNECEEMLVMTDKLRSGDASESMEVLATLIGSISKIQKMMDEDQDYC